MLRKNNKLAAPTQQRGAFCFSLLALAWLQVSLAVHQFEHSNEYVEDSCHVCSQIDRIDDGLVDHPTSTEALPLLDALDAQASVLTIARTSVRGFDSRAPPQL